MIRLLGYIVVCSVTLSVFSQKQKVNWLSFADLEKAQLAEPRRVLIQFYADWCVYCKKMEQAVYPKPDIAAILSKDYYAVRFNVESGDTINFGGKTFVNKNIGKQRIPIHQIPEFLAGRPNQDFELPVTILMNAEFEIEKRFYRYIPPKEMLALLKSK